MEFTEEFDVRNDAPAKKVYPTILPGNYVAEIVSETTKPTKSGTGEYLELTLEIAQGQFAGQKIFDRLNLRNPSTQATAIARETLQAICDAVGVARPKSSADLLDRMVGVTLVNESYNGKVYARIKSYHAVAQQKANAKKPTTGNELDGMPF